MSFLSCPRGQHFYRIESVTRWNIPRHVLCLGMSWIYSLCTILRQYKLAHVWLEFWRTPWPKRFPQHAYSRRIWNIGLTCMCEFRHLDSCGPWQVRPQNADWFLTHGTNMKPLSMFEIGSPRMEFVASRSLDRVSRWAETECLTHIARISHHTKQINATSQFLVMKLHLNNPLLAVRSKTGVCRRSFTGIVGSNSSRGMDVCLLWVLCIVRLITCPEESYRVWCVWVWSWRLGNEEARTH